MTSASTMDSPYYETDAEKGSVTDSMREAFAKAVQTQKEAETTFGEVSNLLAETKGIGLEHELWKEWDSLRQEIPDHIQSAIATAAEFQELIDNLEAFPSKVKVSLENMKRGFWQKLWDFIRQAASFLWDNKMLILDFGAGLLGFFGLGPASLESVIQGGVHSGMNSQDKPKKPSVAEILKEPVNDLKDEVSWEVCVWKSIEYNCLSLQAQYKIAGTLNKRSWGRRLGKVFGKKEKV
ncbi:hypothetical protein NLI96_g10265 [Meripilus lineatus]|uniref:Uncharacterized protein n=1 Tax=Meripilus lineatus TaxID=2056292 RepID=A0AAD5Y9G4_9APHY|nr:hypothetical protein NLI96_g10265 [Physisporinus lineatus]